MNGSWTIGRKLYAGVGALLVFLMGAGAAAYWLASSQKATLDTIVHGTSKRLELAMAAATAADNLLSGQRLVLIGALNADGARLQAGRRDVDDQSAALKRTLDELQPLLVTDEGRRTLTDIAEQLRQWEGLNTQINDLINAANTAGAVTMQIDQARPVIARLQSEASSIVDLQRRLMTQAVHEAESQYSMARNIIILMIGGSLFVGALVIYAVRDICLSLFSRASELRDGASQLVSAASQVAGSSQSLSQGATQQAASLEETSASMEEMASMTRQNAENSQQAAALMSEVDRRVSESNAALEAMVASMAGIQDSSAKVGKIIKTIDEIAFQTNILALNAAVEAARAGEAGMGFAVVADEVRSLAQRSAQAAKDTAGLIEEAGTNAQQGSATVGQVAATIGGITQSVTKAKGLVDEVSSASRQQAQGIDQVTQALTQMERVTQTTAATAEESAAASEELNAQAESAMVVVRELEAMVGGGQQDGLSGAGVRRFARVASSMRAGGRGAFGSRSGSASGSASARGAAAGDDAGPEGAAAGPRSAEEQIPLSTGTYGAF